MPLIPRDEYVQSIVNGSDDSPYWSRVFRTSLNIQYNPDTLKEYSTRDAINHARQLIDVAKKPDVREHTRIAAIQAAAAGIGFVMEMTHPNNVKSQGRGFLQGMWYQARGVLDIADAAFLANDISKIAKNSNTPSSVAQTALDALSKINNGVTNIKARSERAFTPD